MRRQQLDDIRKLEGRAVTVRLADGSVLHRVPLVLARRGSVWVVRDGEDLFLPLHQVIEVRDAPPVRARGAGRVTYPTSEATTLMVMATTTVPNR